MPGRPPWPQGRRGAGRTDEGGKQSAQQRSKRGSVAASNSVDSERQGKEEEAGGTTRNRDTNGARRVATDQVTAVLQWQTTTCLLYRLGACVVWPRRGPVGRPTAAGRGGVEVRGGRPAQRGNRAATQRRLTSVAEDAASFGVDKRDISSRLCDTAEDSHQIHDFDGGEIHEYLPRGNESLNRALFVVCLIARSPRRPATSAVRTTHPLRV